MANPEREKIPFVCIDIIIDDGGGGGNGDGGDDDGNVIVLVLTLSSYISVSFALSSSVFELSYE